MLGEATDDLFRAQDDMYDVVPSGLGRDTAYVDRIDKRLGIKVVRIG